MNNYKTERRNAVKADLASSWENHLKTANANTNQFRPAQAPRNSI